MTGSAEPDAADALYEPLVGPSPLAASHPELVGWAVPDDPVWSQLAARGALLAAAHESGALDGLYPGDTGLAVSLLGGTASLATIDEPARAHTAANYEALRLAAQATDMDLASPAWIRHLHHVACRPQLTHAVHGDHGAEDHVLATGDYKHHPNHERSASGSLVAHAPVGMLREEMQRFASIAQSEDFAALSPVARAAYVHHAITHIAPFADGNGRVARILAGAHLLRAASIPFLVFASDSSAYSAACAGEPSDLVELVSERARALVDLLAELRTSAGQGPALKRWGHRSDAAAVLASLLPTAVGGALDRHRRRQDLGFLSRLTDAEVGFSEPAVTIRLPPTDVDETVRIDAHPLLDDGTIVLRAEQAQLRLTLRPDELLPTVSPTLAPRLDTWLDRAVSTLALRVAADLE